MTGCVSSIDLSGTRLQPIPSNCDDTVAEATAAGRKAAQSIAETALAGQIADVRGSLVSAGLTRVKVKSRQTECRPYSLTGSLVHCRAKARVCGRT